MAIRSNVSVDTRYSYSVASLGRAVGISGIVVSMSILLDFRGGYFSELLITN